MLALAFTVAVILLRILAEPWMGHRPFLLVFLIPRGMTLMSEPTDPSYTRYTTPIWLLAALYVSPATGVGMLVGARPMTPGWVLIVLLYTALIGWGVCSLQARRRQAAE